MGSISRKDIERILNSNNFMEEITEVIKEALEVNPWLVNPLSNLLHLTGDPNHPVEKIIDCSYYFKMDLTKNMCHDSSACSFKQEDNGCVYQEYKGRIIEQILKYERCHRD